MKKKIYLFFIFILLFPKVACSKNLSTTQEILEYVEEEGNEDLTWSNFDHLKYNNIAYDYIEEIYYLKDGNILKLVGQSYERRPRWIVIQDDKGNILEELK